MSLKSYKYVSKNVNVSPKADSRSIKYKIIREKKFNVSPEADSRLLISENRMNNNVSP